MPPDARTCGLVAGRMCGSGRGWLRVVSADAARAHPFGDRGDGLPPGTARQARGSDPAARDDGNGSGGGLVAAVKDRVKAPFVDAAGVVGGAARGLSEGVADAAGPLSDPFVITLIGLLALASALLGGLVLAHLARIAGFRNPESREPLD